MNALTQHIESLIHEDLCESIRLIAGGMDAAQVWSAHHERCAALQRVLGPAPQHQTPHDPDRAVPSLQRVN